MRLHAAQAHEQQRVCERESCELQQQQLDIIMAHSLLTYSQP